jgi:hypothetical protein
MHYKRLKINSIMKCKFFLITALAVSLWACEKNYFTETEIGRMESSNIIYLVAP